jgi:hypothetical protein
MKTGIVPAKHWRRRPHAPWDDLMPGVSLLFGTVGTETLFAS